MTRSQYTWLLGAFIPAAVACSESGGEYHDARREFLQGVGDEIFLPNYREFQTRAGELETETKALCKEPTPEALKSTRSAWRRAHAPWKRNDLLAFGPYTDEPLRLGPKIDFWPVRADAVLELLAGDAAVDAAAVGKLGAALRGFAVIEYLLFEPDVDVVAESAGRRCGYLRGLTADLKTQATRMVEAWEPEHSDYLGNLVNAGRSDSTFATLDLGIGEVVNRLVSTVENVRGMRLGTPLGTRSGGPPQPDSAEARFSGRSIDAARDTLKGVELVCFGAKTPDAQSLARYLKRIEEDDLATELRTRFDESYAALDAIPEPLTDAVVDAPDKVQEAIDTLAELQRLIQVDIINAMGIALTFNDADGD